MTKIEELTNLLEKQGTLTQCGKDSVPYMRYINYLKHHQKANHFKKLISNPNTKHFSILPNKKGYDQSLTLINLIELPWISDLHTFDLSISKVSFHSYITVYENQFTPPFVSYLYLS